MSKELTFQDKPKSSLRRKILLTGAGLVGAGGVLVVGWGLLPARSRLGDAQTLLKGANQAGQIGLNGWIKVAADGVLTVAIPRSEMGQGVNTSLPTLLAEELGIPANTLRIENAPLDKIFGNVSMLVDSLPLHPLQTRSENPPTTVKLAHWMVGKVARELGVIATGGSSSIADAWGPMRQAGAVARHILLQAGSKALGVDAAAIALAADGMSAGGKKVGYLQALQGVDVASLLPKDLDKLPYKLRSNYTQIGQSTPRRDVPDKVQGKAQFGIDVRLPGMLYAAVVMNPQLGGGVASVDENSVEGMPGVRRVVTLPNLYGATAGAAVIADTTWHAMQAVNKLNVQWQPLLGAELMDSHAMMDRLRASIEQQSGFAYTKTGDAPAAFKSAAKTLDVWYSAPYLAHATMEPMTATAQVANGKVTVWAPTQVPGFAAMAAAKVAGVKTEDVTINVTLIGGGFGRKLEVDCIAQAVRIAMETNGVPVQLTWSREQDTTHDMYRPAHVARMQAALDAQGKLVGLQFKSAGDQITPQITRRILPAFAADTPDKTTSEGLFDIPYDVPNQLISHVAVKSDIPIGYWRSVGHSHNAFFSQSFMDEIAAAMGKDPAQLRIELLQQAPRHLATLKLALEKSGWGTPLPAGQARGVALHESFGTIVAQVVTVSVQDKKPRVHSVVCAVECGIAINPGIIAQQVESSVIFGLTAALYGQIDIVQSKVQQKNFADYPLLGLAQAPVVQTHIVPSDRSPTGLGEPALPPIAPAVANALFKLTGQRLRQLPLKLV